MKASKTLAIVISSILAGSLLMCGCAPAETPTPTPTPEVPQEEVQINILPVYALTGYYAAFARDIVAGFTAGIDHYNATGYIPGVEVVADVIDHASDPAKASAAFKMGLGRTPKPVLAITTFSAGAMAAKELLKREQVSLLTPSSNPMLHGPGDINFSDGSRFTGEIAAFADYFVENLWSEARPPRYAMVTWDTAFGHFVVMDTLIDYIKAAGVEYMGEVYIPANCTDATIQLSQLKQWDVDFVNGATIYPDTARVIRDAHKLGLWDDIVWSQGHWQAVGALTKDLGPMVNGLYWLHGYAMLDDFEPWMKDAFAESGVTEEQYTYFGAGMLDAKLAFEAIKIAAEKVGPENVTGTDVYDAFRTIDDFCFSSVACRTPLDFTQDSVGAQYMDIYQMQNEQPVRVEEAIYCPNIWPGGKDVVQ